ncbi:hypothetical protein DVJ78_06885 [Humibacter sp. BT305]|nr:hypothetical protein DVJ78_06885 [Humibacter sp. BT305]
MVIMHVRRPLATAAVIVAVGALLAACTTTSGGVKGDLARSTDQVASAAQSALLAAQQLQAEKTLTTVTETTLEDSLTEVTDAQTQVLESDAHQGDEAALRDRVVETTQDVADAIDAVRESLATDDAGLDAAVQQLQAAADAASALSTESKGLQR